MSQNNVLNIKIGYPCVKTGERKPARLEEVSHDQNSCFEIQLKEMSLPFVWNLQSEGKSTLQSGLNIKEWMTKCYFFRQNAENNIYLRELKRR